MISMIDLFAGTGAFTLAFESTNKVKCIFANDITDTSKHTYDLNFDHPLLLKDLLDVKNSDIPAHDILTAGFPCQPFSIAGKREGFNDDRSNVFWKILSIIDTHRPTCIVLENVKNLLSHDEGKTFKIIKENLTNLGYHISFKVLDTSKITTIPQHRERVYIVGFNKKELHDKFSLDFEPVNKLDIRGLFENNVGEKYYYKSSSKIFNILEENVKRKDTIYQYRRVYVRENKSNECPTLTANMGTGGHNVPIIVDDKGIRKLNPRECFNFQGFPSSYILPKLSDCHLYKLAGNAVSLPVVKLIANRIVNLINQN